MTIYISQGRYTAAAIKGMTAKPEDRSEAVAELFAAAGARLISWYLTLGPYDWLIIAEAPDEPTMISAVLAAAAGGSLSDITTTVALTASDTAKAFQRAGELTLKFRSAGRADYYGVGIDSGREIGEAFPAFFTRAGSALPSQSAATGAPSRHQGPECRPGAPPRYQAPFVAVPHVAERPERRRTVWSCAYCRVWVE